MEQWTIREGRAEDAGRVNALYVQMLRSIYGWNLVEGDEKCCWPEFFGRNDRAFYVAETPERVIGFVYVRKLPEYGDAGYYIDAICVSDVMRGRGVGTALLLQAEAYARQSGADMLLLHVENSNKDARRLYERMDYVWLEKENGRILMMKVLAE